MSKKYFGTDGIRGAVGTYPITPEFMLKLGWAAGSVFAENGFAKILIGKDTRISGYMFESALQAGLSASGADVLLLGPMPTPAVAYLTRTFHAQAGIVISASHNPYYDNGIKFFSSEGKKLDDEIEAKIEAKLDEAMTVVASESIGKVRRIEDARGRYIEFCKSTVPNELSLKGYKIVVDCANGASYHMAPDALDELGAEVIAIGCSPNGLNINEKCGATSPEQLRHRVVEEGADLGIAIDGDGDRIIMVDHSGEVVDGDEVLFVLTKWMHARGELDGGVVGTLMSNLGLELALKDLGVELVRAKVGDRYVMSELAKRGWNLGGESSGHIICLQHTTTGDALISALQVLNAVVSSGKSLFELRSAMKKMPQKMINVRLQSQVRDISGNEQINNAVTDTENKLGDRGRVLLRPSGTEPVVRVMIEGEDKSEIESLTESLAEVVEDELGV